ncbi:MAG TPA: ATP-binding protein [Aquabacterium sp.]|uniref:ATP-binding protein n=1 Tax=Aquabacterium sp. TaxID=1872578 RepID=UPI002E31F756|nr:ATP-binding protein [Aquabacterium sp.]HEX5355740.1 ATP-binding protein [Aquabacterium sp.]
MNWLPRSLFHRNLLLIVVLIIVAQISSAGLFRELVMKPRVRQAALSAARHIQALQAGLSGLPPAQRKAFVERLNDRELALLAQAPDADNRPRDLKRLTALEQVYVDQIAQALSVQSADLAWRREHGRILAVSISLDGVPYWLTVPGLVPGHALSRAWVWGSVVSALLAIGGAWLIQRRLNQPLTRVMEAARALGRGERPPVLPEDGPAEIATVARGFNEMAADLARHEQERALMLAGLSHDLRTPLTKIRLATEMLKGQGDAALLASLDRSTDGMAHLLEQFMDFTRASHGVGDQPLEPLVSVDVNDVVREVVAMCVLDGAVADEVGLQLADLPRMTLPVQGVRRVLTNLVVNAQRHGRPPIAVRTGWNEGHLLIDVMDRGPGIAPELLEHVRQPFAQGSEARSQREAGAGLGLAIVERIAKAHHARLELLAREGGGLVARVRWPVAINS